MEPGVGPPRRHSAGRTGLVPTGAAEPLRRRWEKPWWKRPPRPRRVGA